MVQSPQAGPVLNLLSSNFAKEKKLHFCLLNIATQGVILPACIKDTLNIN
jgi:hypothetical protein